MYIVNMARALATFGSVMLSGGLAPAASAAEAIPVDRAWVAMAPDGGSVARVLTLAVACPVLTIDGKHRPMALRAAPASLPARANKARVDGPLAFPARVCELALPRTVKSAVLGAQALPLPKSRINRIVLIGDTGCRLKASEDQWQACDDPARWPFAAIAAKAAAVKPDLVLHVGDYHYRENACPADHAECKGTTWGYDEKGWRVDFLDPALPLLAAAPWIMVRGNHEECARAGEGWWRLLDPHPMTQDCVDPSHDAAGDRQPPYAVDLGEGASIAVLDLVGLANVAKDDAAGLAPFRNDIAAGVKLASGARSGFLAAHYPLNPVLWGKHDKEQVVIGSKPAKNLGALDLGGIRAMIAGHVHEFQFARFADRPVQVIAGFSGTQEDPAASPETLREAAGKPGAEPLRALSTVQNMFGFAVMEREREGWSLAAYDVTGKPIGTFAL